MQDQSLISNTSLKRNKLLTFSLIASLLQMTDAWVLICSILVSSWEVSQQLDDQFQITAFTASHGCSVDLFCREVALRTSTDRLSSDSTRWCVDHPKSERRTWSYGVPESMLQKVLTPTPASYALLDFSCETFNYPGLFTLLEPLLVSFCMDVITYWWYCWYSCVRWYKRLAKEQCL